MFDKIEDTRTEFKEILNDKLEKEIVGFLNTNGGNLYIGINNNFEVIGIKDNIDTIQLEIKDKLKNNILPSTLGLFDIEIENINNKNIIHISVARGIERPYYIKKKGMTPEGCFIRIGSSTEKMSEDQIRNLYSNRTRNSIKNIVSPIQQLSFSFCPFLNFRG